MSTWTGGPDAMTVQGGVVQADEDETGNLAWCSDCQATRAYGWPVDEELPACEVCSVALDPADWT